MHDIPSTRWWQNLSRYQWFVFIMATLAWLFDCLDQQLFLLARPSAMKALGAVDPKAAGGTATAVFLLGWATGGLILGAVGDRIGRARTLALCILLYALCTGLSAFSHNLIEFNLYRFITGVGVGGVFGLAVALVADGLPEGSRSGALGTLQALSAVGNMAAGLIGLTLGNLEGKTFTAGTSWKWMFLVGAIPALICFFVQLRLAEPEKWVKARALGQVSGVKFGSYASLFGEKQWQRPAIFGMLLCVAGIVGLWGIGFFSPELVGDVIKRSLKAEGIPAADIPGKTTFWIGVNMILQNGGSFLGMLAFTQLAQRLGRKPAFALGFLCAFVATVSFFTFFNSRSDIFWLSPIMGFCQLALFAGFAIYLPELFPTRLRSTGTSFCYNVGRFIAASGPWTLGMLQAWLAQGAKDDAAKLMAFRHAACYLSGIFFLGFIALMFLPETNGRPLPEDIIEGELPEPA